MPEAAGSKQQAASSKTYQTDRISVVINVNAVALHALQDLHGHFPVCIRGRRALLITVTATVILFAASSKLLQMS